jgi:hypothetical protein
MLLSSQHEDGKDELGGQEHLDEKALNYYRVPSQSCSNVQVAREHTLDETSCSHTTKDLGDEQQATTNPEQCTDPAHAEGDLYRQD